MEHVITIKGISKRLGKQTVLSNINMTIEKGQIYGFIGPSGAGKTTLVKLIVGMLEADTGSIHVLDKKVPNLAVLQQIGYMAQADALYHDLTGEENLAFFASMFSLKKTTKKKRISYYARVVDLTGDLKKKVSNYSGGMKRRLSLAIALIQNPEVIILDEPTVGIDPELRRTVWNELIRLKEEMGKTIIITTHVMDEAEKCDHIAMIRDGAILEGGSPLELKNTYGAETLEEVFLHAGGAHR